MHGFERFLRAVIALHVIDVERFDVALERGHILGRGLWSRASCICACQFLDAALDRADIAEAIAGRFHTLQDRADLPFQVVECAEVIRSGRRPGRIVVGRLCRRVQLLRRRSMQIVCRRSMQMLRQRSHPGDAGVECVDQFLDATARAN